MSFHVEPDALRTASGKLATSAGHLRSVSAYQDVNSDIGGWDQGAVHYIENDHGEFADALTARLADAARHLAASAQGLLSAAQHYETCDASTARQLDATYQAGTRIDQPWRGR